ncbi:response regulator [Lachnospiraceae bacterium 46-15]
MITVYIADDEVWITIGLKKLIEKSQLPFQVIGEASNGVTALEDVKRLRPDVLLTDIRMPGMSGLELLNHVTENLPTRVVLISGYAEFEYALTAIREGAFDYLLKPVQPKELNRVLQNLCRELLPTEKNSPDSEAEATVNPKLLDSIFLEMQNRYTENISLTELSQKYGVSSGHLSALIKKELGLSFSEYITSRRIQKAQELLKNESLSVEEVANAAGYHDYFYFTKVFKKTLGISPSKYRKQL